MADEPSDGSEKNRDAPTVRDLKGPEVSSDTLPDVVGLYVPPRPLPEPTHHRTLDLRSIRLSDEADPRRALTKRLLVSPPTPSKPRRRIGPWLGAFAVLLLAAGAWALFWKSQPEPRETPLLARPATVTKTLVTAGAAASRSVPPPVVAPAEPSELVGAAPVPAEAPEPKPEAAEASPPASKSARQRESAKKRKDPWLE